MAAPFPRTASVALAREPVPAPSSETAVLPTAGAAAPPITAAQAATLPLEPALVLVTLHLARRFLPMARADLRAVLPALARHLVLAARSMDGAEAQMPIVVRAVISLLVRANRRARLKIVVF